MDNSSTTTLLLICALASASMAQAHSSEILDTIHVTANKEQKDEQGKDDVYYRNITNMYADKETVERYKGASPADLLQEFNGVYSGDARNSGAVDPNIRGVQGQGRIPVTIDGTEQAITTWRGYNGANNRNYLDPNLISNITVEKGPDIASGNASGIGGSVKMRTLDADDIVREGQKVGVELKLETANNSVKERIPDFKWGQDYREAGDGTPGDFSAVTLVKPKQKGQFFKDNAMRLAVGVKEEKFDLLAAYSYRSKGNYLAGKGGAHKYEAEIDLKDGGRTLKQMEPNLPFAASIYRPGSEIPNTSSMMESYLLKGTLHFTPEQNLKLGYRDTKITYGEIMPSRLDFKAFHGFVPQWPLATVKQKAFNADYAYNPQDNRWVNLKAGVWYTQTESDTNTSGGNPREMENRDVEWTLATSGCVRVNPNPATPHDYFLIDHACLAAKGGRWIAENPNTNGKYSYVNAAQVNAYNTRRGFNLSNTMNLTEQLDLTLSGAFQKERLTSNHFKSTPNPNSTWESPPRMGRRQEWDIAFNFNYRPTNWLILTAGARYNEYWSFDDYLQRLVDSGELYKGFQVSNREPRAAAGHSIAYERVLSQKEWDTRSALVRDYDQSYVKEDAENEVIKAKEAELWEKVLDPNLSNDEVEEISEQIWALDKQKSGGYGELRKEIRTKLTDMGCSNNCKFGMEDKVQTFKLPFHSDGRPRAADNPFVNGTLKNETVINPLTGKSEAKYQQVGSGGEYYTTLKKSEQLTEVKKRRGRAFSPAFSATAFINDQHRVYLRYTEYARMPSIFEDTIGFSSSSDTSARFKDNYLKPEKAKNIEVGYVYDASALFSRPSKADLKLSYFHNVTKNVIDRSTDFRFYQLDKRVLEGIELQARYDNGRFFGDLGVVYNLKNQVCDVNAAMEMDPVELRVPSCMTGGFAWGYLRTQLQPKYSISSNLGARFFDRKLEVGTRWLYHSKAKNRDEDRLWEKGVLNEGVWNRPMSWQPVLTLDAYIKYAVNKNLILELTGTNLTNRYYLDPMTRSMIPAPGRTVKLGLTAKF
ncbi:TonB-dependent receptor [Testudinibacter sp. TR-2022]|uniref:TonB-dependent receptor domain-containing protein n=2 Tax=Testudinibacter sp. TR-2022 TaxID=2585029 RepID=UPI001118A9AE|nr:TonB-dependent receptor [Testudinibacter sp. TR-2022]TNH05374.1 TonB-dependent receptor [Pasteurellaceae bacterium Phil31]TNH09917.1 TonB-dependent receptor [Testudinibacter sp. TR-2022]TNH12177.1 TonB-dependent receptor [Testudinibacter sp. TR-2022]TNH14825.1 TonB-dependent receptor [Testudinibacter sp. TR-2022]TNH15461.1 TonB-dependent receptor [Testudinibacter sp. TR-2022]